MLLLLLLKSVKVDDDVALLLSCTVLGSMCTQVSDSAVQTAGRHRYCCSEDAVDLLVFVRL